MRIEMRVSEKQERNGGSSWAVIRCREWSWRGWVGGDSAIKGAGKDGRESKL